MTHGNNPSGGSFFHRERGYPASSQEQTYVQEVCDDVSPIDKPVRRMVQFSTVLFLITSLTGVGMRMEVRAENVNLSTQVAQAINPCAAKTINPCAAKTLNPCAAKTLNSCAAKTLNPCAAKTLNPCAAKTLNPCAAKVLNPCLAKTLNPCAAKTLN